MRDQYKKVVKIDDPVLVEPLDHTGSFVGKIVGFSDGGKCCHVEFNDKTYTGIYPKRITYWRTKQEEEERRKIETPLKKAK